MTALVAICVALTLIAVLFLVVVVRQTRRGRLLRATGSLACGAVSAALASGAILLLVSYIGYERLTAEAHVADIHFARAAADEYTARLMLQGRLDKLLIVRGDEWQLDARIVTWKPPATILGLSPVYQLERLSGRYSDIELERSAPRSVHGLATERPLDLWSLARRFPDYAPGIDAYYGTATYLPMADGARFRITVSRDALIARPVNQAARDAVGSWNAGSQ